MTLRSWEMNRLVTFTSFYRKELAKEIWKTETGQGTIDKLKGFLLHELGITFEFGEFKEMDPEHFELIGYIKVNDQIAHTITVKVQSEEIFADGEFVENYHRTLDLQTVIKNLLKKIEENEIEKP